MRGCRLNWRAGNHRPDRRQRLLHISCDGSERNAHCSAEKHSSGPACISALILWRSGKGNKPLPQIYADERGSNWLIRKLAFPPDLRSICVISANYPMSTYAQHFYFSFAPTGTSSRKPASTGLPSSPTDAATIMPFDSSPRSLRG
jgi:hypothetical protein